MEEGKVIVSHCNQCEKDWTPRVDNPACCPRCKRYDWREPKKGGGSSVVRAVDIQSEGVAYSKRPSGSNPDPRSTHDPKTCKVHRCGLCAVAKEK